MHVTIRDASFPTDTLTVTNTSRRALYLTLQVEGENEKTFALDEEGTVSLAEVIIRYLRGDHT